MMQELRTGVTYDARTEQLYWRLNVTMCNRLNETDIRKNFKGYLAAPYAKFLFTDILNK